MRADLKTAAMPSSARPRGEATSSGECYTSPKLVAKSCLVLKGF